MNQAVLGHDVYMWVRVCMHVYVYVSGGVCVHICLYTYVFDMGMLGKEGLAKSQVSLTTRGGA